MSEPTISLRDVKERETVSPHPYNQYEPYVRMSPAERHALVEAVEAAQRVETAALRFQITSVVVRRKEAEVELMREVLELTLALARFSDVETEAGT